MFSNDIEKFKNKALAKANLVSQNIISGVADEVIFNTPVDTGRARANWQLGVEKVPTKIFENSFDADGNATANKLKSLIPENVLGLSIYIANNLPYIHELENGKSKQAPVGMVALTQLRFKTIIRNSNNVI
jgi:hypothetical protein